MKNWKNVLCGLGALIVLGFTSGCHQIPPSHVGIKYNGRTGINSQPLEPSVVSVNPLDQERVEDFPTKTINVSFAQKKVDESDAEGDAIVVVTQEGVPIEVDTTVAFHVDKSNAVRVFETFGTADMSKFHEILLVFTQEAMVNAATKMSFAEIVANKKALFGDQAQSALRASMSESGFTLDNLYIQDMRRPNEIEARIKERLEARQELGNAQAEQKRAEQEAQTILIKAQQQAEQNRLLGSQSGSTAIKIKKLELRKLAIEKWKKAGGEVPRVGTPGIPFTNIQLR
jgi:regulator of protease activity HflC (stomatin/prohibitin superfamily)